jgi:hypothetical protein
VIVFAASLVATGTAGFVAGGTAGAVAGAVLCTVAWLTWWRLRTHTSPVMAEPEESPSVYADVEDVIDQLDDLARERGWDLPKRLEIARMACENRATPFDELERRYDRGLRSAIANSRSDDADHAENAEP